MSQIIIEKRLSTIERIKQFETITNNKNEKRQKLSVNVNLYSEKSSTTGSSPSDYEDNTISCTVILSDDEFKNEQIIQCNDKEPDLSKLENDEKVQNLKFVKWNEDIIIIPNDYSDDEEGSNVEPDEKSKYINETFESFSEKSSNLDNEEIQYPDVINVTNIISKSAHLEHHLQSELSENDDNLFEIERVNRCKFKACLLTQFFLMFCATLTAITFSMLYFFPVVIQTSSKRNDQITNLVRHLNMKYSSKNDCEIFKSDCYINHSNGTSFYLLSKKSKIQTFFKSTSKVSLLWINGDSMQMSSIKENLTTINYIGNPLVNISFQINFILEKECWYSIQLHNETSYSLFALYLSTNSPNIVLETKEKIL